ncbi:hypothetical protein ACFXKV_29305 [Streptomyces globisporus]|uniref:hypothetical protein n=1 Tax=Streptomyces globisporus TaxID=1908 RepID=UPI0015E29D29
MSTGLDPSPVGSWIREDLPEAIERAMSGLDPQACDRMDPGGVMVDGTGGLDEETRSKLVFVPCAVQDALWLTPDQQIRLVAVASLVTGAHGSSRKTRAPPSPRASCHARGPWWTTPSSEACAVPSVSASDGVPGAHLR